MLGPLDDSVAQAGNAKTNYGTLPFNEQPVP